MAKKKQEPVPFNDRLILFRYFLKQFGKENLKDFSRVLNSSEYEGYDENQNTWFYVYLKRYCSDNNNLNADKLRIYDENICLHVKKIGENRDGGIVLKYYQYISLLFTEMYLDRYFSDRDAFIKDLNDYIDEVSAETLGMNSFTHYTAETMNKLAFMCATGSGKTLIMHINILQFLHYLKRARRTNSHIEINKIIVLSPNEGMSNQHLEELKLSSISAQLFSKDLGGFSSAKDDVIVIDMNKLKEEGKVKTVSVDSFEQNNLVLVDEGHRGLTGDVWKEYRDKLSTEGFAFEYSATFKQALKSQKAKDMENLMDEYGKAIIMDYSYKYFYEDGYGKDYRIYNLKESVNEEQRQLYLVGCLMSFYQQVKLYNTYRKEYAPFHIKKPLLVFVGNRVTAPIKKNSLSTAEKELLTDVEQVLQFIDEFVKNKAATIKRIDALINEDTGLTDGAGNELFYQDFNGINTIFGDNITAEMVYEDIMSCVFNADSVPDHPRLHIVNLRQIDGEIALKIGEYNDYFGVISVGDTAALVKKCADDGMVTDTEEFYSDSLFSSINSKDSNVNILVGSRKFSEGWNSWRVSTMGLINFAKGEGSQAIQLFGRGVRLRGYEGCLKRSNKVDKKVDVPKTLMWLETLTIFGIKAQYMEDFKKYLEMEDLGTNETVHEFELPILSRFADVKDKKLQVIKLPKDKVFKKQAERMILTAPDEGFFTYLNKHKIIVDCRSKVQTIESSSSLHLESTTKEHTLDKGILPYLNYTRIYEELQRYKNEKLYYNISIDKSLLKSIMESDGWYALIIPKTHIQIDSVLKLEDATDYAIMVLKIYMDKFFVYNKEKWEEPYMSYFELTEDNEKIKFKDNVYKIRYTNINDNDTQAEAIQTFIKNVTDTLAKNKCIPDYSIATNHDIITAFDFKKHLYAPLVHLNAGSLKIEISPVQMNDGEMKFVGLLKDYLESNPDVLGNKELYLLRNKSKVGMGFFEAGNFYPDFILWIKEPGLQRISFVDPKGLMKLMPNDPKIEFYKTIKELQARLQSKNEKVILNSFIMSITPAQSLKEWWKMSKPERESKNVLCLDNDDCIKVMLNKILADTI